MLGQIILIAIQFAVAFFGAPQLLRYIPVGGDLKTFAHAAAFGVIVWIAGLVGSFALKDVNLPSSRTLGTALAGALIGAALIVFVPQLVKMIPLKIEPITIPLVGAIVGYMVRR
jgi:hypothetical protein